MVSVITAGRHLGNDQKNGRAAAPCFRTDGGVPYMISEAGGRLAGSIVVARG
jgi:hypothetical protein